MSSGSIGRQFGNPQAIRRLLVEELYGQFTYQLGFDLEEGTDLSNLIILYGDNGSGKTTVLQLIMHLLSPEDNRGHKTAIARIPFKRFAIFFADGTCVEAFRNLGAITGTYSAKISMNDIVSHEVEIKASDSGELLSIDDESERIKISSFNHAVKHLRIFLHYLSDDRKTYEESIVSRKPSRIRSEPFRGRMRGREWVKADRHLYYQAESEADISPLEQAIGRAYEWIREQAYIGSGEGERNTNTIYNEVVKLILEAPPSSNNTEITTSVSTLHEQFSTLSSRSKQYSKFGLVSMLDVQELLTAISNTGEMSPDKARIIYNVLKPYAEGIEARLDALKAIHDTIQLFVDTLRSFYKTKHVDYDLRNGLKISTKQRERLAPKVLSSGEKQILLLFCNTLAAKDQESIFIIDEPEISLNVKWQRQLVHSLLECVHGSPVQFILATHSIELLARHKHNVLPLRNLAD